MQNTEHVYTFNHTFEELKEVSFYSNIKRHIEPIKLLSSSFIWFESFSSSFDSVSQVLFLPRHEPDIILKSAYFISNVDSIHHV